MRKRKPGKCKDCQKITNSGKSRCSSCYKKWRRTNDPAGYLAMKQRHREKKFARGLCMYCNRNPRKSKRYCVECLKKLKGQMKKERRLLREEVIKHYGVHCTCCGEKEQQFLTIDHINGGGNKHRRELKASGINLYRWLKNNNYPEGFRVRCFSCNCAAGIYGMCPHERQKLSGQQTQTEGHPTTPVPLGL